MKKILCAFLVMVFAFSFVACNKAEKEDPAPKTENTVVTEYFAPVTGKDKIYTTPLGEIDLRGGASLRCFGVYTSTSYSISYVRSLEIMDIISKYTFVKQECDIGKAEISESTKFGLMAFPAIFFRSLGKNYGVFITMQDDRHIYSFNYYDEDSCYISTEVMTEEDGAAMKNYIDTISKEGVFGF